MTPHPTREILRGGWKGIPLTIGLAIAIVTGAVGVIVFALRGSAELGAACENKVKAHQDRDVDRAHPDLVRRYVSRQELGAKVHKIDRKLERLEAVQQIILTEVRNGGRGGRRPRGRTR